MRKVRIGFVGTGFMGQLAHLSNYAVLDDDCEVVAIAEPRRELARQVARRYGVEKVYANHLELLENCEVDAIVAAQPYAHHLTILPDIIQAGKAVFTEKPLALSVEAGEKLVRLSKEKGVLHMVGYHKRSDPAMEYAHRLIQEWKSSGAYGKMKLVRITMPPGDWMGGAPKCIRSNEPYPSITTEAMPDYFDEETGRLYDAFVNYYIHQVNAMRFLMGEPYRVAYADPSGILMVAEGETGVCGVLEMAPYQTSMDWQETMLVAFERGYVRVDLPAPLASQQAGRVTLMQDKGTGYPVIMQPVMPPISAMRQQAKNFIAAIKGEREAPCTAEEALEDLRIARDYIRMYRARA
ncbi:MAG: Gfo/Idh/MocA family protein [Clostridia bacterium]|jgi:predicted dehydrogenase